MPENKIVHSDTFIIPSQYKRQVLNILGASGIYGSKNSSNLLENRNIFNEDGSIIITPDMERMAMANNMSFRSLINPIQMKPITPSLQQPIIQNTPIPNTIIPVEPSPLGVPEFYQAEKFSEGGIIKGTGDGKSDSIISVEQDGTLIVPIEKVYEAKKIYRKYINKDIPIAKPHGNGTVVRISNNEFKFTPQDLAILDEKGVDYSHLLPNYKPLLNAGAEGLVVDDDLPPPLISLNEEDDLPPPPPIETLKKKEQLQSLSPFIAAPKSTSGLENVAYQPQESASEIPSTSRSDVPFKYEFGEISEALTPKTITTGSGGESIPKTEKPKTVAEDKFGSDFVNALAAGSSRIGANLARTPSMIYEFAALPQNIIAKYTGLPIATSAEEFAKTIGLPENKIAEYYDNAVLETKKAINEKYDKGVSEYFSNGEYEKGFKSLALQIAESAPVSISLALGGAAGATTAQSILGGGAVFAADKLNEIESSGAPVDHVTAVSNAISNGLFEGMFEQFGITKLGGIAKNILTKEGKGAAKKIAEKGFKESYGQVAKKYLGIGAEESISEAATQFAQNVVDKYSGYKPDLDLMEGVKDAAIVGLASAGAFSATPLSSEIYNISTNKEKAKELIEKKTTIENDISNPNIPDQTRAVLSDISKGINEQLSDLHTEDKRSFQSLSEENKIVVSELNNGLNKIGVALSDANLSTESKSLLQEEQKNIQEKINQVETAVLKPKEDAIQIEKSNEEMLLDKRPEVGLQEVGEGNKQQVEATNESKEVKKEVDEGGSGLGGGVIVSNVDGLLKKNKIEGKLFNEQEAKEYQELIESKYNKSGQHKFGQDNEDIRQNAFSYDQPLAEKDVNGINVRIAEGLIEGEPYSSNRRKTYLLYADGVVAGKFYSVSDAKKVVDFIEANLVKSLPPTEVKRTEFVQNKTRELQMLPDEDYVSNFINEGHLNSINSNRDFGFRPDFRINTKDIKKGIEDIKNGKDTAAARHLKNAILETKKTGIIPMIEGTGGMTSRTNIPLAEFHEDVQAYDDYYNSLPEELKQQEYEQSREPIDSTPESIEDGGNKKITNEEIANQLRERIGNAQQDARGRGEGVEGDTGAIDNLEVYKNPPPTNTTEIKSENGGEKPKLSGIAKSTISEGRKSEIPQETNWSKISDTEFKRLGKEEYQNNPKNSKKIVKSVLSGEKSVLEPVEVAQSIHYKADLDSQLSDARKRYNDSLENGEPSKAISEEIKELEADIKDYETMAFITASSQSSAFRLRQYLIDSTKFDINKEIEYFKSVNEGKISKEDRAFFEDKSDKIKELEQKIKELESEKERQQGEESFENIQKSVERESPKKTKEKRIKDATQKLAAKIRQGKVHRPKTFSSASPASLVWDGALEIIAKTIETGGSVTQAVADAIEHIKSSDWYKSTDSQTKKNAEKEFSDYINDELEYETYKPTVKDGKLTVPPKLIRDYIKSGVKDIEALVDKIYERIKDENPEITKREVRDAITGYGKEVNKTKDQITTDLNKAKRLGKLISKKEDLQSGYIPIKVKAGLEKKSEYEQNLNKEIKALESDLGITGEKNLNIRKTLTKKKIEEYERMISEGDFSKKEKAKQIEDDEIIALKSKKEALLDEVRAKQYENEDELEYETYKPTVKDGKLTVPPKLIRDYIKSGVKDIETLVDKIHERIKEENPEITKREVRDAITGYGKEVNKTKDQITTDLNKAKRLGKLISKKEDLQSGYIPIKVKAGLEKKSEYEQNLNKEIKALESDLGITGEKNLNIRKTLTKKKIEEYERMISEGDFSKKEKAKQIEDDEIIALKSKKEALLDEVRAKQYENEDELEYETYKPTVKDGKLTVPPKLIRDYIKSGVKDIETLVDKIHERIKEENPEITKREVRDAITGYGKEVNKTKDQITTDLNKAKRLGKLISKKEDLQSGYIPIKVKAGLEKKLEYEQNLNKEIKALESDLGITGEKNLNIRKTLTKKKIEEYERMISEGDFSKKEKAKQIEDDEIIALKSKKEALLDEVRAKQYENELEQRTFAKKSADFVDEIAGGVTRLLVAGFDLGAMGVQGAKRMFTHPLEAKDAFIKSIKSFGSTKHSDKMLNDIKAQPWYSQMKEAGVKLNETDYKSKVQEEIPAFNIIGTMWNLPATIVEKVIGSNKATTMWKDANPYAAAQRAFNSYVNHIRTTAFLDMAAKVEGDGVNLKLEKEKLKAIGDYINVQTGRGGLGKYESSSQFLSTVLFSARRLASTIQFMNPLYYAKMPKHVRKQAIIETSKTLGALAAVSILSNFGANDEEDRDWEEFFDPNSSNFLSIKVKGENGAFETINFGNDMKSLVNVISRVATGKYTDSSTGVRSYLGERYGKNINSRWDALASFLINKASPGIGLIKKVLDQKKGSDTTAMDIALESSTPMWMGDLMEIYESHPDVVASLLTSFNILGIGMQHYKLDKKKIKERKSKERLSEKNKRKHEKEEK